MQMNLLFEITELDILFMHPLMFLRTSFPNTLCGT